MKTIFSLLIAIFVLGITMSPRIASADGAADKPRVEIHLTGRVEAIEMDTCMDGATHLLIQTRDSQDVKTRLKPMNDGVKAQLAKVSGKKIQVTVAGHMGSKVPQCEYLEIYSAEPAKVQDNAAK